jgi:tetrahydromethanopterin S-methyltransferase subunit G
MANPVIIETDLKDILDRIDKRLDRMDDRFGRIEQKLEALPRIEARLDSLDKRVENLEGSQRSQIWALIITVIGATITAVVKFGFFPNP